MTLAKWHIDPGDLAVCWSIDPGDSHFRVVRPSTAERRPHRHASGERGMDVNYPAAVLAGGLGTRLWPRTAAVPKVLVETAGYPFLHHVLWMLARRGFERIVLCVGHLGSQVEDYVGDGSDIGLDVSYSHDSPSRPGSALGTATALRGALLQLRSPCFWAINGDTYLDVDDGEVEHLYTARPGRSAATIAE